MTQFLSGRQSAEPNSARVHELKLSLKVHHREESHALSGVTGRRV